MSRVFNKTFLVKILMLASLMLFGFTVLGVTPEAFAADSVSDAMSKAGIKSGSGSGDDFIKEGKYFIYFLMAIGGLIIVGCMIMAALALSATKNGQKRTDAIWWLVGCFAGSYIVYKAFELVGWSTSLGS